VRWKVAIAGVLLGIIIFSAGALIIAYDKIMYPINYKKEILTASEEFSVDPILVASVINAESRFKIDAVSEKGAVGLMQLKPSTAEWVVKQISQQEATNTMMTSADESSLKDILYDTETHSGELLDPGINIRIGTFYLSYLLKKFDTTDLALCAYNAGEGTVKTWLANEEYSKDGKSLDKIPYKETQNYIEKIHRNLKVYSKKLNV